MADRYRDLRRLAIKLLDEAFQRLTQERVLPRSRYEPWIHVGSEFEGWLIMGLPSHSQFEAALQAALPLRFGTGQVGSMDFASLYASNLVTSAVARLSRTDQPYEAKQPAALEVVRAFLKYVSSESEPVVMLYAVAGVQTEDDRPLKTRGLSVVPCTSSGDPHTKGLIERIIPGAGYALHDASLFLVGLPSALLVASTLERFRTSDHFGDARSRGTSNLNQRLDGLVSGLRLATNGTVHVLGHAIGQPGPFQSYPARVGDTRFRDALADVRRVVTLDTRLVTRVSRLDRLWRSTVLPNKGIVPTLTIAIQRFNRAFGEEHWQERLTDLAVALEAAMGQENDPAELSLRLRNRAAALLADESDDAGRIFDDLGVMYDLRSRVLHGSSQDPKKLMTRIEKVPAAALDTMPGTKVEFFIDRSRDLVRRAILARLLLGQGDAPEWPLSGAEDLDRRLSDDRVRQRLRKAWRAKLRHVGLASAAGPAVRAGSWHESKP